MQKIFFLILLPVITFGQQTKRFTAEICQWQNDKKGAVSITFDDASYTQYEYAFPILEKYGLKATFSLVGEWTHDKPEYSAEPGFFEIKKMGWEEIKELHRNGHEISAHGYEHKRYGKYLNTGILAKQMKKIKDLIEKNIKSGIFTLQYPYSFTSDSIISGAKKAGFLFGRTNEELINSASPANMLHLLSKAILNNDTPGDKELTKWLQDTEGKWLILMYHHLFPANSLEANILKNHSVVNTYSLLPATFENHIKKIAETDFMIAPVAVTGKYITERNNTELKLHKCLNSLKIKTKTSLDTSIYNQPVTIKVSLPWEKVKISNSEHDGIFEVKDHSILVDVLPGKTVKIKKR